MTATVIRLVKKIRQVARILVKVECNLKILLEKFKTGTYLLDLDRKLYKVECIAS